MYIRPEVITCKNGKEYCLRSIVPEDTEQYVDFMYRVSSDTHFMMRNGDEVGTDEEAVEQQRKIIEDFAKDDKQGMMPVLDGDRIIGNIAVRGNGKHRKTAHRCSIGIGVRKEYQGLGIGSILMEHALDFAKNAGYEVMELGVFSDNEPALALYKKMGFIEWGRMPDAFRLDDGTSLDEITMYKKL